MSEPSHTPGHADATADFDSTTPSALSALERHNLSQIENYLGPNIRAKIVSAGEPMWPILSQAVRDLQFWILSQRVRVFQASPAKPDKSCA